MKISKKILKAGERNVKKGNDKNLYSDMLKEDKQRLKKRKELVKNLKAF